MELITGDFWSIVWLSLSVSGMAVFISSCVGIPLGVWLGMAHFRFKRYLSALVHTGMAMPPVVVGLVLYLLLSRSGPMASLGWLFTAKAMVAAQTVLALPFVIGITMNALSSLPEQLTDQIKSLGASRWQCRWALLREAKRGVVLAVAAAFGRSISEVGAVLLVGGNIANETRVLTTAIILETRQGDFQFALLLGAALLLMALFVNVLIVRLQGTRS